MDYPPYLLCVEEQWMICNMRRLTTLGICVKMCCMKSKYTYTIVRCHVDLDVCPTLFVRMVIPLRMYEFADIVKERAFSWVSIVRVKHRPYFWC